MANLNIIFNQVCVVPVITDVSRLGSNITIKWATANVSSEIYTLMYSVNGGTNYVNAGTFNGNLGQATIIANFPTGQNVKFKIISNTDVCVNIESSVFDYVATSASTIFVNNVSRDLEAGTASFDIHVEGEPFVGYLCGIFTNNTINNREKQGTIAGYGISKILIIPPSAPKGAVTTDGVAVTIPVGVHFGEMYIDVNPINQNEGVSVDLALCFSFTNNYENGLIGTFVELPYMRFGEEA